MGLMENGRAKYDPTPVPRLREIGLQREFEERSSRKDLVDAREGTEGTKRLKEMVEGMTREPRAAIDAIEREIGSSRDLIAEREQMLVEAIDQHANLSTEAVRGMDVVRKALAQIRDAFNAAIRPMPPELTNS